MSLAIILARPCIWEDDDSDWNRAKRLDKFFIGQEITAENKSQVTKIVITSRGLGLHKKATPHEIVI